MYVISYAGLRFGRNIVNVHVYSVEKILRKSLLTDVWQ